MTSKVGLKSAFQEKQRKGPVAMWSKRSHSSAYTEQTSVLDIGTVYRVSIKLPFMKLRPSFIVTEVWKCKSNLSLLYYTYVNAAGTHARAHALTNTHTQAYFSYSKISEIGGILCVFFLASTHRCRKIVGLQYSNVRKENKQKLPELGGEGGHKRSWKWDSEKDFYVFCSLKCR